ncbi:MAG: SLBB domain-containing protein [Prevotellaceae bacterium]|nr:SLBB domain-containing protein [Candidatus Colivivens caballi]
MSDEQVIEFVRTSQEKGDSQAQIIQKLQKRGVTVQQVQNIRRKLENGHQNLGAVSVTNKKDENSRLRTNKQEVAKSSNVMTRIQHTDSYLQDEQTESLNSELGFITQDPVDKTMENTEEQVFGRNLFNNSELTFQPAMNIATPANYRLGAGDVVIIDVWGASQETFQGTISPDGTVTIEGIGPIKLGGQSVSQATGTIKSRLGRYYEDCNFSLSVGDTRSIMVQVMGEVKVPGTYTLNSLSTAFNALYSAGGINEIGTLRNIKVYRSGRQIATIDVYDYLLNGNSAGDIRLQDNDIIVVGPYESLVRVKGRVKRPMFYEMKPSESVATLIDYAGGFTGDAYRKNLRLIRKNGAEYSVHTIGEFDMKGFTLNDGDSIFVSTIPARYSNMVEVRGAVMHPGMFQLGGDISTVRELLNAADGLSEDAFSNRAVMHRQREDKTLEVVPVDVIGILNGTTPDIPLQKNDVLFIASRQDNITDQTIEIAGEVMYPGIYQYAANTTLEDIVVQAGGLTNTASTSKVDIFRRIYDPAAVESSEQITETFSFALKDGFVIDGEQGFILKPFDKVVVRKSPSYTTAKNVQVSGAVHFAGTYSASNKHYRLSDLIKSAGGLSAEAYAKGARLERTMTEEERMQRETSMRSQQIALYEASLDEDKNFNLDLADSLLSIKLDLGNTYPVAINLDKALANPGKEEDVILREGDHLIIPQYSSTVKVSGEVMYPNSMNYQKGETLKFYIDHAGGYNSNARKSRVYVIYMNGSVERIKKHSSKAIQPGCEIVIPSKQKKSKMTTAEIMALGTSASSIATMMVSIANILK